MMLETKKPLIALALVMVLLCPFFLAVGTPKTLSVNADSDTIRKVEFNRLWSFQTERSYVASPVYADGFIYVITANSGSGVGTLYCLNASSGTQQWNITTHFTTFTISNGIIYIGGSVILSKPGLPYLLGAVSCLNAHDGTQVWNYSHGTGLGAPVVVDGVAYVPGFNCTMFADINIGFIFALDASTGEKIWDFQGPVGTRFDDGSLVLADSNLYALSAVYTEKDRHLNSAVYAFDAATGVELWNYSSPGRFHSLVASAQIIYAASNFENTTDITGGTFYDGGVLALNASDGNRIWNYPIGSSVESLILADSYVYAVAGNGNVYAFDSLNGRAAWINPTNLNTGPALLVDGSIYVGTSAGAMCIDSATGRMLWNFATDDYAESSPTFPVYSDGVIYVGWNGPQFFSRVLQHDFYAIDALSGERIGNYTLDYTVKSEPIVKNNTIYVGASWVTEESIDYLGPGAVVALNLTVAELPRPSAPFPFLEAALFSVIAIAVIAGLLVYFRKRKTEAAVS